MKTLHEMLDNPTLVLESLYDLVTREMDSATKELNAARVLAANAQNEYDKTFRTAQLRIQQEAENAGQKMTIAERELKAANEAFDQKSALNMANVMVSAQQDILWQDKALQTLYESILSWKQSELKSTPTSVPTGMERPREY